MSMVSHAVGSRFIELVGGAMTSFYDWYADLPVASPQVFGDQTDVPESGDWWNATYLLMWGSNVPVTRTPDAHWMAEARYKGQKVVVVSPDYADNTKFADTWLPAQPGTDGALAMAMGHVDAQGVLRRAAGAVLRRLRAALHRPAVPRDARGAATARTCPGSSSPRPTSATTTEGAAWKTVLVDGRTGEPVVPNGSMGFRYTESGVGRWNLDLDGVAPQLTPAAARTARPPRCCCRASTRSDGSGGVLRRGVPVRRVAGRLVTTVFDLMLAQYGVQRDGSARHVAAGLRRRGRALHARLAGADHVGARRAGACGSPGRWPPTPRSPQGRTMIIMGAGICQWFHGDATYRAVLALLHAHRLDGPQRRRLGALRRARRSAGR